MLIPNLIAQIGLGLIAMTICLPSMQEWGAIFHASQASVQLTFSAYAALFGAMQLVYGPLSDRYGRVRPLLFGLALFVVGSTLAALAPSLAMLTVARAVQAAGAAAGIVLGRSLVQDLFQGPDRTRVMAYIGMTMGLCPPTAMVIGGQLHVWFGWRANFVLLAVLGIVLWWAAWRSLPRLAPPAPPKGSLLAGVLSSYATLLGSGRFVLYVAILAFTTSCFAAFLSGAPVVLRSYGVGPAGVGWYVALVPLSYFAGNYATSILVRRVGERRMMWIGQAFTLAGPALVILLAWLGLRSPLAFALPLMLLGLGHGLLMPVTLAGTIGLLPALAGAAAAVAGAGQQLTGALSGYLVGWLNHDSPVPLSLMMIAVTCIAVLANAGLGRNLRPVAA